MRCNDFIIETKPVIIDSLQRQVAKVEPLKLQVFYDENYRRSADLKSGSKYKLLIVFTHLNIMVYNTIL